MTLRSSFKNRLVRPLLSKFSQLPATASPKVIFLIITELEIPDRPSSTSIKRALPLSHMRLDDVSCKPRMKSHRTRGPHSLALPRSGLLISRRCFFFIQIHLIRHHQSGWKKGNQKEKWFLFLPASIYVPKNLLLLSSLLYPVDSQLRFMPSPKLFQGTTQLHLRINGSQQPRRCPIVQWPLKDVSHLNPKIQIKTIIINE